MKRTRRKLDCCGTLWTGQVMNFGALSSNRRDFVTTAPIRIVHRRSLKHSNCSAANGSCPPESKLWEGTKVADKETISGYKRDLCTIRHLLTFIPSARTKLYLYEGCYRVMCNLNPITSQNLFERSLRKRRQNQSNVICTSDDVEPLSLSDTSDIASALIHMSNHLPNQVMSCPGEREGYLREAAEIMAQTSSSRKKVVL